MKELAGAEWPPRDRREGGREGGRGPCIALYCSASYSNYWFPEPALSDSCWYLRREVRLGRQSWWISRNSRLGQIRLTLNNEPTWALPSHSSLLTPQIRSVGCPEIQKKTFFFLIKKFIFRKWIGFKTDWLLQAWLDWWEGERSCLLAPAVMLISRQMWCEPLLHPQDPQPTNINTVLVS